MLKKIAIFIMGISVLLAPNFAPVNADDTNSKEVDYKTEFSKWFWANDAMWMGVKGVATSTKKNGLMDVVKNAINWTLGTLWLITFILLLWAGFQMVTAAGDDKKFGEGLKILKNAGIGLLFIAVSWLLVSMLFWVIGVVSGAGESTGVS